MSSKIEDLKDERVPQCLYWTVDDVANWIQSIGFPDYKDCFVSNFINGRGLICVTASNLPRLGVTDFKDILTITEAVRKLLTIEKIPWDRSISLAPAEELALYLERKSKTGKERDLISYTDFLRDVDTMKWQPPLANHSLILPGDY